MKRQSKTGGITRIDWIYIKRSQAFNPINNTFDFDSNRHPPSAFTSTMPDQSQATAKNDGQTFAQMTGIFWKIIVVLMVIQAVRATVCLAQTCAAPPAGLVGWWPAEKKTNSIAGYYQGNLRNGATFATGTVGQAFRFDGVDDYVLVPYSESFNFAPKEEFTIETWGMLEPSNRYKAIIVKGPPDGYWDWGLWCNSENRFEAGHHHVPAAVSKTVAQAGVWYHVAVTYKNGNWVTYVNGVAEAQTENNFIDQSAGALTFGRKGEQLLDFGEPGYFRGLLDEPSLYNRALSAAEIKSIFEAGSAGKCFDKRTIATPGAATSAKHNVSGGAVKQFAKNKHFYELVQLDKPVNWYQAKSAAEQRVYMGMPGHLATMTSKDEQNFVSQLCLNFEPWIGGFQAFGSLEPDDGFQWITGEPFLYTNWRPGEPNNTVSANGTEDVLLMAAGGAWNDAPRRMENICYVVEYEPQAAVVVPKTPQ